MSRLKLKIVLAAALIAASPGLAGAVEPTAQPELASPRADFGSDGRSIIYNGEVVRLSRNYSSYDDYLQDPNNIDPAENAHVERLMTRAQLARRFANRAEAFDSVTGLQFPGYGLASLQTAPSRREWRVLVIEIPRAKKNRYVAITDDGANGWSVIDDFVADERLGLASAEQGAGEITYRDGANQKLLVHLLPRSAGA